MPQKAEYKILTGRVRSKVSLLPTECVELRGPIL
jgi:hypothetical protein